MAYYPYIKQVDKRKKADMLAFLEGHEKYCEYDGKVAFANDCKLLGNPLRLTPEQQDIQYALIIGDNDELSLYKAGFEYEYHDIVMEFCKKSDGYVIAQVGRTGAHFAMYTGYIKNNDYYFEEPYMAWADELEGYLADGSTTIQELREIVHAVQLFDLYCKKLMDCLKLWVLRANKEMDYE